MLVHRENSLLPSSGGDPSFGAAYSVTAYPVGARASQASSGTTATVDAGHSFRVGDKALLRPGSDNVFTAAITAVTATTISWGAESYPVYAGDQIVNMGPDTGTTQPNYNGSPMVIYRDGDGTTTQTYATVTSSSVGEYAYWHKGDGRFWELLRDGNGTVTGVVAGFGAVAGRVNVCDYGASESSTGNTPRIQAAIVAAESNGGAVFVPDGTFELAVPSSGSSAIMVLTLSSGIKFYGAGSSQSVLKMKDEAGAHFGILGVNSTLVDLSGLEVTGLTFDHNIDNQTLPTEAEYNTSAIRVAWASCALVIKKGGNIRIHNNVFANSSSVNEIIVNGSTGLGTRDMGPVWITDNHFTNFGEDPASTEHDMSVIYTNGDNFVITGNVFEGAQLDAAAATTAIETHSSETIIANNVIRNFANGMIITGISSAQDDRRIVIDGNTIEGAANGIKVVGTTAGVHTTGYGIDGMVISNNVITLVSADTWSLSSTEGVWGIYLPVSPDIDNRDIIVTGNIVRHPLETADITLYTGSFGIGGYDTTTYNKMTNLTITGNTVINFPGPGIYLRYDLENCLIAHNVLVNPGSTLDADRTSEAYHVGIRVLGEPMIGVDIKDNYIVDTNDTTRMKQGIHVAATGATTEQVNITDNTVFVTGSTTTAFVQHVAIGGAATETCVPYCRGAYYDWLKSTETSLRKYALGSRVIDLTDGLVYVIGSDQYTWSAPSTYTQTYSTADRTHAAATAATLTDSTTGSADQTVQALTDPADTPASVDALRDDLVANLIPELRNNFAECADEINKLVADVLDLKQLVNGLIDDLQAHGLVQ